MALHWVRAKIAVRVADDAGHPVVYPPGEWFQVRNQQLRQLRAQGAIDESPSARQAMKVDLVDCGIVVFGSDPAKAKEFVKAAGASVPVESGGRYELKFPRTLLWDGVALRAELVPVGFHRLATGWQIAVPLYSYGTLCRDIGSDEEKQRTKEVIHDLRVPFYDTRVLYVRRCPDTERFMKTWRNECKHGDERLAFMRALFKEQPVLNALPVVWMAGTRAR